jgi:hypothetical protein
MNKQQRRRRRGGERIGRFHRTRGFNFKPAPILKLETGRTRPLDARLKPNERTLFVDHTSHRFGVL